MIMKKNVTEGTPVYGEQVYLEFYIKKSGEKSNKFLNNFPVQYDDIDKDLLIGDNSNSV